MSCEKCAGAMIYNYEVDERHIVFVLWDCECGHKMLERKYKKKQPMALATVG